MSNNNHFGGYFYVLQAIYAEDQRRCAGYGFVRLEFGAGSGGTRTPPGSGFSSQP
jgi:hypothetical protein